MIDRLIGIIEEKTNTFAIILVNGVGYRLNMSVNSLESLPQIGQECLVLTYLHVREDILDLYGFSDRLERNVFHLLISISGIGPKLALTILSGIGPSKLKDRIIAGDVNALTSIPGVGAKTAKRIIIELKEKFIKTDDDSLGFNENLTEESKLMIDIVSALTSLGYKEHQAKKVFRDLEKNGDLDGELELVIKKALKQLS
tara:strand:- start:2246 stop:2845 length:600 start_codon:yes stop_codon:yes gene_type:complete